MKEKDIINTLNELYENRQQTHTFHNVNLKTAQLELISAKEKLDSYSPTVIKQIEKWLSSLNDLSEFDETQQINLANGINLENFNSGNSLYEEYLNAQKKYIEIEKEVNKYSKKYKEMKNKNHELEQNIINQYLYLINDVLKEYFSDIKYDENEIEQLGKKAIMEAIDTYKLDLPISFTEYTRKIITNYLKKYFTKEHGYNLVIYDLIDYHDKEYIIKKLISMLKTNMSIYDIYNRLNNDDHHYDEPTISKCFQDIKSILEIFTDNDSKRDIALVCNIYEIDEELAKYIWENRKSIIKNINEFLEYNKF